MSKREELEANYPKGTDLPCIVKRVEPVGVFVQVEGAPPVQGLIRPRDWSWARRTADLASETAPGDRILARVVGHTSSALNLSRRLTLPDPFPEFCRRHKVGDFVLGRVELISHRDAGIRVALEHGVGGFIPRSEIPETASRQEGLGLFAQDVVATRIRRFEKDEAILSIKEHLRLRDRAASSRSDDRGTLRYHPTVGVVLEDLSLTHQLRNIPILDAPSPVRQRIDRVLVVEDNGEVSDSLALAFGHLGFTCDLASSVDEGIRKLGESRYDLLILDINLPAKKGGEIFRVLAPEKCPRFVFALTAAPQSDWAPLVDENPGSVTAFFQKPASIGRILDQLARLLEGEGISGDDREHPAGFSAEELGADLRDAGARKQRREEIEKLLAGLAQDTGAGRAFVLSYKPGPFFELVAGRFLGLTREVQQDLDLSPVGELIKRRTIVNVADVTRQKQRFQHLLKILSFHSFAGCPIPHEDQAQYGLFLIGERPLQQVSEERLRNAAALIAHAIAQDRFDAVVTENQGLLLTGFLADSLLHEVKNEVQALGNYAGVQHALTTRYATDFGAMSPEEVVELKRAALGIQTISGQLEGLITLFRNLAGQGHAEEVDPNRTIERLFATLKPLAEDRAVLLESSLTGDMPAVTLSPKLLDQSLLNVMINAIEQMSIAGGSRRVLHVTTEYHPQKAFPVKIRVADTGPGIHFVHQERIFDLFFTTKEKGTGLGLYISRFFLEQLGGRLTLATSILFSGTEFLIELPREVLE